MTWFIVTTSSVRKSIDFITIDLKLLLTKTLLLDNFLNLCMNIPFQISFKPENVVCIEPNSTHIKLIDFGLARQLEHGKEMKITCGTPEFVGKKYFGFML